MTGDAGDQDVGILLVAPAERALDLFLVHALSAEASAEEGNGP
jgi:hypothetical protein